MTTNSEDSAAGSAQKMNSAVQRVERAMADFRAGKMVILTDDEDRENEGDLILAAEMATPEAINFMATHGRGLICLTMTADKARRLELPLMVRDNQSPFQTAFTVSIEAAQGVTTGISAADRAKTIRTAASPNAKASDLVRPGHIFPLIAREGGVLVRTGQTEGSVDLARLSGLIPSGVLCEIMKDDGTMARRPDLEAFAAQFGLSMLSVADIIAYRMERERLVERVESKEVELAGLGRWTAHRYRSGIDGSEHLALVKGMGTSDVPGSGDASGKSPLVRVQNACLPGELFGVTSCDCQTQMQTSLKRIAADGCGAFIHLSRPGAMELTCHKERLHALTRHQGEARLFDLGIGAQILRDLDISRFRLLTDTAGKAVGLQGYGLSVTERVPLANRS